MRYIRQHITAIIGTYDGSLPLAHFLKNYLKQHPKLGSRDRRIIGSLVYSWYRCSKGIEGAEWLDRLLEQCISDPALLRNFRLELWLAENKDVQFDACRLLPADIPLSVGIDRNEWLNSMLVQPDLFIRSRHEKKKITDQLTKEQIPYSIVPDNCIALPNGTKIDQLLQADSYVVQDASSQRTGEYFHPLKGESWYDCCAGAGGKSLLLKDLQPEITLTVSDKRDSILHNLARRFEQYHHTPPARRIVDVADKKSLANAIGEERFDNIICDAPCSGSGTWARTPEQLYFFDPATVEKFTLLQKRIATNVAGYLKPGGKLFYITCSVFKTENEDTVNAVISGTGLRAETEQLINGLPQRADSMFITVLVKE